MRQPRSIILGYTGFCPRCHGEFPEDEMPVLYGLKRFCRDCYAEVAPRYEWECACGRLFHAGPAEEFPRCIACRINDAEAERERVKRQLRRAQLAGTPATLTATQWMQTLRDFNGLCAYCRQAEFSLLEHFEDVSVAGTTVSNCVPACANCNARKQRGRACGIPEDDLNLIRGYLALRAREERGAA